MQKACSAIDITVSGRIKSYEWNSLAKSVHVILPKAYLPIEIKCLGNGIKYVDVTYWKAESSISVIQSGKVIVP